MKKKIFLILLLSGLWSKGSSDGIPNTPSSPRYKESTADINRNENEKSSQKYTSGKNPGFYTTVQSVPGDPLQNLVSDMVTGYRPKNDNILILKFNCDYKGSIIPIAYRYKPVSWKFVDFPEIRDLPNTGMSRTDGEGFFRLRFSTYESLKQKAHIELNFPSDFQKTVYLGSGLYEIMLPESICRNK